MAGRHVMQLALDAVRNIPARLLGLCVMAFVLVVSVPMIALGAERQEEPNSAASVKARAGSETNSGVLQLDSVIASTLNHHPALKGEKQERVAANAELLSAQGAFDPSIKGNALSNITGGYSGQYGSAFVEQPLQLYGSKVFAGYRVGDGSFPIYDNYYETLSGGETQFGFEVPLLRDGPTDKRRTEIRKSESGQLIADALIEQKKIELARAAALTYWDWTAARNKLKVDRKSTRLNSSHTDISRMPSSA